jgi:hypothetical protein
MINHVTLQANSTFMLRDSSWGILFPHHWHLYRKQASIECTAKLKVLSVAEGTYTLMLMEVSPVDGKLFIPSNLTTQVTQETLERSMLASKMEKPIRIPDRVYEDKHGCGKTELKHNKPINDAPPQMKMRKCYYCKKEALLPLYKRYCSDSCRQSKLSLLTQS